MHDCPHLTPRLTLAADFVRPGARLADIGTDHAYLPVYLLKTGRITRALACDINRGPLGRALATVKKYGVSDRVELRLSDGLDRVAADEAEDIVIAGMGGELIRNIVAHCSWMKDSRRRLILQPMTSAGELREFLVSDGFSIVQEAVAREGNKLYVVICAEYTGSKMLPNEIFKICGTLPRTGGALEREYLLRQAESLFKKADGMRKSRRGLDGETTQALAESIRAIAEKIKQ
ncbi:MAG TPA: class I SAM-dependent methyltransferase [Clostridia bacterium]|nr:class I SAM-dependent methyltransferase [Clostridia bacterium]